MHYLFIQGCTVLCFTIIVGENSDEIATLLLSLM